MAQVQNKTKPKVMRMYRQNSNDPPAVSSSPDTYEVSSLVVIFLRTQLI
jgi:hypothetical protein